MTRLKKIIPNDQVEALFDLQKYQAQTKAHCDNLIIEQQQQFQQATQAKVEAEITNYKQIIDNKINEYLTTLTTTLLTRVGTYLQGVITQEFDSQYLKAIITQEINQGFSNDQIIITAHESLVEQLQSELMLNQVNIKFIIDNNLAPNGCICENKFYKILIDPANIQQKITQLFGSTPHVEIKPE